MKTRLTIHRIAIEMQSLSLSYNLLTSDQVTWANKNGVSNPNTT